MKRNQIVLDLVGFVLLVSCHDKREPSKTVAPAAPPAATTQSSEPANQENWLTLELVEKLRAELAEVNRVRAERATAELEERLERVATQNEAVKFEIDSGPLGDESWEFPFGLGLRSPVWDAFQELPGRIGAMTVREQAMELAKLPRLPKNMYDGPEELRFSCVVLVDFRLELWHRLLRCDSIDVSAIAAQIIWKGHSSSCAKEILEALAAKEKAAASWAPVRRLVDESLQPDSIIREINGGDKDWGLWLAALRPDPRLVPTLLAAYQREPTGVAAFALGSSRDARAFHPLVAQLKTRDYVKSGYAAQGLGLLWMPEAETPLLDVLDDDHLVGWGQANVCLALGKIGTAASIPRLEVLAKPHYTGAIGVARCAQNAIKRIKERQATSQPQET